MPTRIDQWAPAAVIVIAVLAFAWFSIDQSRADAELFAAACKREEPVLVERRLQDGTVCAIARLDNQFGVSCAWTP